jgi:hypothetical protein
MTEAFKSWLEPGQDFKEELGDIMTTFTTTYSMMENGKEIGINFTPLMDGKILDQDTMNRYYDELKKKAEAAAKKNKTSVGIEMQKLDSKGLEIDGKTIKNLYMGTYDSIQKAEEAAIKAHETQEGIYEKEYKSLKKLGTATKEVSKLKPPKMEFLKDGTLSNPEEIRKFWTDAANSALTPYNELLEQQKTLLEKIGDVEKVDPDNQKELDRLAKELELRKEIADAVAAAADVEIKKMEKVVESAEKMQEALAKGIENVHNWLSKEIERV